MYNKRKKLKLTQIGRTMLEMLGVLAIVGVLSIGGVQAYRTAIIRKRVNEVIDYVTLLSMKMGNQFISEPRECSDFNKPGITVPSYLDACQIMTEPGGSLAIFVHWKESPSESFFASLKSRCSSRFYIDSGNDQTIFIIGNVAPPCSAQYYIYNSHEELQ